MTTDTQALGTGRDLLSISPVIPVVVLDSAADAVPLARALARGGVRIMEITLRTAAGLEAIERVAAEVPETTVGAGTVTTPEEVAAAVKAGAQFIVTPGCDRPAAGRRPRHRAAAAGRGEHPDGDPPPAGARPAGASSSSRPRRRAGPPICKAVVGPVPDVSFCPTGGIGPANAAEYLALPNVGCVGGSWLTPAAAVRAGDWAAIERLAGEVATLAAGG